MAGKEEATAPATDAAASAAAAVFPAMSPQERYNLARSVGCECVNEDELLALLTRKAEPVCYDGFEPSGRMHVAQGLFKAINVNKLTQAGCRFVFWVADWFAMLNNKCDADLGKIQKVGRYMIEVWKAVGMDMTKVEFLWSSEEINKRSEEYWERVMDIARRNTLKRILRCGQIMGRPSKVKGEEEEAAADGATPAAPAAAAPAAPPAVAAPAQPEVTLADISSAQILYPCMQCADIFFLKADICQLGLDQRKVNMLAREYCDQKKIKNKPIILSHRMLMGLKEGMAKMSKSIPDSAIFMEDTEEDVYRKIENAYCPERVVENNPIFDYLETIIFNCKKEFLVERSPSNKTTYCAYQHVVTAYTSGDLCAADLKRAVAKAMNALLIPVREHFINDPVARDLLAEIKTFRVTR